MTSPGSQDGVALDQLDEFGDGDQCSSPIDGLPLGLAQLVLSATHDDPNLLEISREYHSTARVFGDPVTYLEGPGNHFAVIDPADDLRLRTAAEIARAEIMTDKLYSLGCLI